MRTPLIAGNWKMYCTLPEARALVKGIADGLSPDCGVEVLVCPPSHLLFPMAKAVVDTPIKLGAQDAHEEPKGAFTGEVSVPMLAETGATYVIIGHSERRHIFGEAGERLGRKVRAVVDGGLTVIYCVGETLDDRDRGRTLYIVKQQLDEAVNRTLPADRLVIAYEPVWAIGTGRNATPAQAQEVHAMIREHLAGTFGRVTADATRILYGGSVKPANAAQLLGQPDIDGALVGGASLAVKDFLAIIAAAESTAVSR